MHVMDVTPQLIEQIDFAEKFRGYDPDQVDDFLERVGATLAELTKTSRDAIARAERAEAELRNAPEASRAPAAAAAAMSDEEEAMQSTRTLMMAKRTADAAIADARQEAQKLVADARTAAEQQAREARTEADRIVGEARVNADQMTQKATAEANREYGARRDQILAEIGELENRKVGMASQLVAIEGRLEEYRSALSGVHGAIGAVLDDPETALRSPLPGIDLAGIVRPVAESANPTSPLPTWRPLTTPRSTPPPTSRPCSPPLPTSPPTRGPSTPSRPTPSRSANRPSPTPRSASRSGPSRPLPTPHSPSPRSPTLVSPRSRSPTTTRRSATARAALTSARPHSSTPTTWPCRTPRRRTAGGADLPWSDDRLDDRADEAPVGIRGVRAAGARSPRSPTRPRVRSRGRGLRAKATATTATTATHAFTEFLPRGCPSSVATATRDLDQAVNQPDESTTTP